MHGLAVLQVLLSPPRARCHGCHPQAAEGSQNCRNSWRDWVETLGCVKWVEPCSVFNMLVVEDQQYFSSKFQSEMWHLYFGAWFPNNCSIKDSESMQTFTFLLRKIVSSSPSEPTIFETLASLSLVDQRTTRTEVINKTTCLRVKGVAVAELHHHQSIFLLTNFPYSEDATEACQLGDIKCGLSTKET